MSEHNPDSLHEALIQIAVLKSQLQNMIENVKLQAHEYERRLTELNHAHAQSTQDKQKFVNVDLFYSKLDEITKAIERLNGRLSDFDQWRSRIIGIGIGASMAGGVAGGGAAMLFQRLFQ